MYVLYDKFVTFLFVSSLFDLFLQWYHSMVVTIVSFTRVGYSDGWSKELDQHDVDSESCQAHHSARSIETSVDLSTWSCSLHFTPTRNSGLSQEVQCTSKAERRHFDHNAGHTQLFKWVNFFFVIIVGEMMQSLRLNVHWPFSRNAFI